MSAYKEFSGKTVEEALRLAREDSAWSSTISTSRS